jgi:hypothetical protein
MSASKPLLFKARHTILTLSEVIQWRGACHQEKSVSGPLLSPTDLVRYGGNATQASYLQSKSRREHPMTWHELYTALEHADPASEVLVVLYRLQGAPEVFALEQARDTGEYVRLAISEEEPAERVREHDTEG